MTGTPPIATWEQAGIILLFILFASGFLAGLYAFIKSILGQFETFITKRDQQMQTYYATLQTQFGERNNAVVDAIRQMTKEIKALRDDFGPHDDMTREAIARMDERTRPLKPKE